MIRTISLPSSPEPVYLSGYPRRITRYLPDDYLKDDCIRLMRLTRAASIARRIECRTERFPIHQTPRYTALSYACGPRPANRVIIRNGHDWFIRENLFRFLDEYTRLNAPSSQWLWIDAICINQDDNLERTHQVTLMADIYASAYRVLVWLGPAYENSEEVMDELSIPESNRSTSDTGIWSLAMLGLCERPYWRRLWVLQELKLAKRRYLMCGSTTVSWKHFTSIISLATCADSPLSALEGHIEHISKSSAMRMIDLVQRPMEIHLLEVLYDTRHLSCEEKLDKIYALLGSIGTQVAVQIEPDYTVRIPALLNRVLRIQHSHSPPENLGVVYSQCSKLERIFGIPEHSISASGEGSVNSRAHQTIEEQIQSASPDYNCPGLTLSWAVRNEHIHVQRLIQAKWLILLPSRSVQVVSIYLFSFVMLVLLIIPTIILRNHSHVNGGVIVAMIFGSGAITWFTNAMIEIGCEPTTHRTDGVDRLQTVIRCILWWTVKAGYILSPSNLDEEQEESWDSTTQSTLESTV